MKFMKVNTNLLVITAFDFKDYVSVGMFILLEV